MTPDDRTLLKLTIWRENREGGNAGMQSVANAILNRSQKHGEAVYDVCTDRLQFTSITGTADPELSLWAKKAHAVDWAAWQLAEAIVVSAENGALADLTGGATVYYAPARIKTTKRFLLPGGQDVPFPEGWNPQALKYTVTVEGQLFFDEV